MTRIRWGILGPGRITTRLVRAVHASSRGDLVAVGSRDPGRAAEYAARHGIPRQHGSYEALLADSEVDAVYIAVPNHLHASLSIAALDAGKHVLCEKPIALSVAEVDAIEAASVRNGRIVAEAFMAHHHQQALTMIDHVRSGRLGDVRLVRGSFSYDLTHPGDVRLDPALGGGALWDVGTYPVSFARRIAGAEPVVVQGLAVYGTTGIDDSFVGQMRFADGMLAQIDASFRMPHRELLEVVGSKAAMRLEPAFVLPPDGGQPNLRLVEDGAESSIPVPEQDQYQAEVEDLEAAILDGTPTYVDLAFSRGNTATLVGLLESARANVGG